VLVKSGTPFVFYNESKKGGGADKKDKSKIHLEKGGMFTK